MLELNNYISSKEATILKLWIFSTDKKNQTYHTVPGLVHLHSTMDPKWSRSRSDFPNHPIWIRVGSVVCPRTICIIQT